MDNNIETVNINTTSERFFNEYLIIKKPLLEHILTRLNNRSIVLNPKTLQVFAMLLHYNNLYRNMENGDKWKIIFDNGTRKEIADKLNINAKHLNTYISVLRNIKLLNGKTINKPFIIYPDDEFSLTYKFSIKDA